MGEDIYVFLESKLQRHTGEPIWFLEADFYLNRNKQIQRMMKLNDEGDFNPKGLPEDCCEFITDKFDSSNDYTNPSWFTLGDLERVKRWHTHGYEHYEPDIWPLDWEMVLAALRVFGDNGRIVFWFRY